MNHSYYYNYLLQRGSRTTLPSIDEARRDLANRRGQLLRAELA